MGETKGQTPAEEQDKYRERRAALKALRKEWGEKRREFNKCREALKAVSSYLNLLETEDYSDLFAAQKALGVAERWFDVDEQKGTYVENFKFEDGMHITFKEKLQP